MICRPAFDFRCRAMALAAAAGIVVALLCTGQAVADELLAAWEFNDIDISGTNISASGGTAANTAGILQADASIAGGALSLDGDGDYLQFGDNLTDLRTQNSFTMAAWVNTNSEVASMRRIVEHEDNTYFWAENNQFQYTTHGTPGGTGGRALSTTAPTVGTWQHVLAVYNEDQPAKLYIDGVLEGTSSVAQAPVPNNTQTFQIGARRSGSGDPSNFWDGLLDDVAIWDIELAPSNIDELAGVGAGGYTGRAVPTSITPMLPPPPPPPPPSGAELVAHWTMDDADVVGDTINDIASSFNGMKTNGGPTTGVAGQIGQAAQFAGGPNNADAQFIDLSAHASTLGALSEGTLAAWVKPETEGLETDVLTIFAASDASAGSVEVRWFVSNGGAQGVGNLVYGTRGSSANGETRSSGVDLFDGEWHHVAATVAADDTVSLYIDGEPNGSGTGGFFGDLSAVDSMAIGRNKDSTAGGGQWFYDGLIDDVRIYDKAMTAAEIQQLVPEPSAMLLGLLGLCGLLRICPRQRARS